MLARVGGEKYASQEVLDVKKTLASEEIAQRAVLRPVGTEAPQESLPWVCSWPCSSNGAASMSSSTTPRRCSRRPAMACPTSCSISWSPASSTSSLPWWRSTRSIDWGRRGLMLIGFGGLAAIYAVLGVGFYLQSTGVFMLVLVVSAIACYAMSLAPVTWVLISEIFPNRIRGAAMSVAVFSLWVRLHRPGGHLSLPEPVAQRQRHVLALRPDLRDRTGGRRSAAARDQRQVAGTN